jgi:hypothetical protein
MKLNEKEALQLATRKHSFGHSIAQSSKNLLDALHQIVTTAGEQRIYEAIGYAKDVKKSNWLSTWLRFQAVDGPWTESDLRLSGVTGNVGHPGRMSPDKPEVIVMHAG